MLSIRSWENVGIAPIIAQTSCKYKRPVTFPDNLTIAFSSEMVDEARGDFRHHYIVYSENQDSVVSEGTADIVSYNYKDKKEYLFQMVGRLSNFSFRVHNLKIIFYRVTKKEGLLKKNNYFVD